MADLNWDDLRILLAVAECGSLSAAAEQLRLSQPTVGRRIRALEASLKITLVEKISTRLELSAAGERILAKAKNMTHVAQSVLDEAHFARKDDRPIHISATGSISLFLSDHLATLQQQLDNTPILLTASRERANLYRRDADIALRMRKLPTDGDLVARKLARIAFSIYAPKRDIKAPKLIGLPPSDRRPSQSAFFDDWAGARKIDLRLEDVTQRYRAICAGGTGLLPCWLGDMTPGLARLISPPTILQEDLYLLLHRGLQNDPRLKALTAALHRLFKVHAQALSAKSS